MKWVKDIGPGVLIAAAFIGPGTVTLCTIAGVSYGYSLIWAIILSIFATIFLQELSLRIGLATKMNVAEVIRKSVKSVFLNRFLLILIVSSILIGNAAYEAGNITGASLGLSGIINYESWSISYYFSDRIIKNGGPNKTNTSKVVGKSKIQNVVENSKSLK